MPTITLRPDPGRPDLGPPDPSPPQRGWLAWKERVVPCALGRGGIVADKHEGDGGTPAAALPLVEAFWRADRLAAPRTALPLRPLAPDDGWCDDPADPAYNRPVRLPYPGRHERMWRDDGLYDVVVVLGWNDRPPVPGRGSAIFLHLARPDYTPTEGCVALALPDLLALLEDVAVGDTIQIPLPQEL